VTAQQALHLMLSQTQLELAGWQFIPTPPFGAGGLWRVCAKKGLPVEGFKAWFTGAQRHEALAQALHYAVMTEGTLKSATTAAE
jgi:hypothetical protein